MENVNDYKELLKGNVRYQKKASKLNPNFFKKLAQGQSPKYLWIGCSDSRIPVNEITDSIAGNIFVHRNIANLVVPTDFNLLSVLQYAVEQLKVDHIIVCGHYGCGGVTAALTNKSYGFINNWLRPIKDNYSLHKNELFKIKSISQRADRLSELNVLEQVKNLSRTKILQKAWKERSVSVHAWVYNINDGKINVLSKPLNKIDSKDEIYKLV